MTELDRQKVRELKKKGPHEQEDDEDFLSNIDVRMLPLEIKEDTKAARREGKDYQELLSSIGDARKQRMQKLRAAEKMDEAEGNNKPRNIGGMGLMWDVVDTAKEPLDSPSKASQASRSEADRKEKSDSPMKMLDVVSARRMLSRRRINHNDNNNNNNDNHNDDDNMTTMSSY